MIALSHCAAVLKWQIFGSATDYEINQSQPVLTKPPSSHQRSYGLIHRCGQPVSSMILIAVVKVIATTYRRMTSRIQPLIDIDTFSIPGIREPVSCLTHLLAVPIFIVLGYFLVQRGRGNFGRAFSLAVMAASTVFLLSVSSVYHLLGPGAGRDLMLQLDVAGIFALIAGTVTPVHAILFRGFNRWAPLLLVWSAAAIGITLTTMTRGRIAPGVGTDTFLLMGWGGLISCIILWKRFGFLFVRPLILGGVAYTVGAIILSLKLPPLVPGVIRAHELWHVAVLLGLGLHWKFVFQFAGGPPDKTESTSP
jgi:channel protein (hemolysin III family)